MGWAASIDKQTHLQLQPTHVPFVSSATDKEGCPKLFRRMRLLGPDAASGGDAMLPAAAGGDDTVDATPPTDRRRRSARVCTVLDRTNLRRQTAACVLSSRFCPGATTDARRLAWPSRGDVMWLPLSKLPGFSGVDEPPAAVVVIDLSSTPANGSPSNQGARIQGLGLNGQGRRRHFD